VGRARFPSIRDRVRTDVRGWTLADRIDDEPFALLAREGATVRAEFGRPCGTSRGVYDPWEAGQGVTPHKVLI
jgi:hypothetical protein